MIDKIPNVAIADKRLSSEQLYRDGNLYIGWAFVSYSSRVHLHSCYELEFMIDGEGNNRINDSLEEICSGSYWFCQPGDIHSLEVDGSRGKFLTIKFNETMISPKASSKLLQMQQLVGRLNRQEIEQIISQIEMFVQLVKTMQSKSEKEWLCCGLIDFLLALCFSKRVKNSLKLTEMIVETGHENLLKAIVYIKKNINKQIRIKDLCEVCNYTPNYLSRLFKKVLGETITDYINKERMKKACFLVKNSNYTISEISDMLGFFSPYYFSVVFKKYYKMSPSQYKGNVKKETDGSKGKNINGIV